jgi:hypothetical protein
MPTSSVESNNGDSDDASKERRRERERLVSLWLEHFGVSVAAELDLGTLSVLHEWIEKGYATKVATPRR